MTAIILTAAVILITGGFAAGWVARHLHASRRPPVIQPPPVTPWQAPATPWQQAQALQPEPAPRPARPRRRRWVLVVMLAAGGAAYWYAGGGTALAAAPGPHLSDPAALAAAAAALAIWSFTRRRRPRSHGW